jgi:hypothetical protein
MLFLTKIIERDNYSGKIYVLAIFYRNKLVAFLPSFQRAICNVSDCRKSSFRFINKREMHNILRFTLRRPVVYDLFIEALGGKVHVSPM